MAENVTEMKSLQKQDSVVTSNKSAHEEVHGELNGQFNDKRRSRGDRKLDCDASSKKSVATAGGANITIVDDFASSSAADTNRSSAPVVVVATEVDATGSPGIDKAHDGCEQIGESINIPINIWNANYDEPSSYDNL